MHALLSRVHAWLAEAPWPAMLVGAVVLGVFWWALYRRNAGAMLEGR